MSTKYKKRFEAYFLTKHPKGTKWATKKAAKYLRKANNLIARWSNRCNQTGNVDDNPGRGLTRTTTKSQDKMIINLFLKKPILMLRQPRNKLATHGLNVSLNTIRKRLQENNVKHSSTLKKPLLSEKLIEKRCQWANENINRD